MAGVAILGGRGSDKPQGLIGDAGVEGMMGKDGLMARDEDGAVISRDKRWPDGLPAKGGSMT